MSYFKALKLTKKGEQLQAKVNGNLSETLVFTRAKLGAGTITSEDEIRFLTDIKEMWGTANVSSCKIEGEDKNRVALELQFSNAELVEDKIFREIGLFAKGNDNEEILYAYANAADKYDYIPLMKDSPHSFIIVISFIIASGTKIDANIDLNSYVSLKKFNEEMAKKANKTDRASTEEYGLTKYGTEEGTSLEGNKFAQMTGKDYGGILNIAGQKEAGKAYWDNNTKKLYICKNNNNDISPNVNNYVPFDSNSLLERLENLITFKSKNDLKILKIGNMVVENISIPGGTGIRTGIIETDFKEIISITLTPYISYGQQVDTSQSVHDDNNYIIQNKRLRIYCNGNQTVDICIVGLI
jgi:hypothetical protein